MATEEAMAPARAEEASMAAEAAEAESRRAEGFEAIVEYENFCQTKNQLVSRALPPPKKKLDASCVFFGWRHLPPKTPSWLYPLLLRTRDRF